MVVSQTIWVLQWERYTSIAKSQDAPPEFWELYKKIPIPSNKQITEREIQQLKALMTQFKIEF